MLFDTGSCEFWVPAEGCSKFTVPAERCAKHARYSAAASTTAGGASRFLAAPSQRRMLIQYLSGKVEGALVTEDVRIGALTVPAQQFGAATTVDVPLLDEVAWDGIVGLAYPSSALARKGVTPLFDNCMARKLLPSPVFGYYLGASAGMVTLGAVDLKYIAAGAEFAYAKVTHRSYWTVGVLDIVLTYADGNRVSTGVCAAHKRGRCRAIIDTGTYLVYGPRSQVNGALVDIKATACAAMATLPTITFVLYAGAGAPPIEVPLAPADYMLQFYVPVGDAPADECSAAQYAHPDGAGIDAARCKLDCVTGIAPDKDSIWTLGQVFLRNYYAVFDRATDRVGFARAHAPGGSV